MKATVSVVTTEECDTRQPIELGMGTTPSFLMYHSVDYKTCVVPENCFISLACHPAPLLREQKHADINAHRNGALEYAKQPRI